MQAEAESVSVAGRVTLTALLFVGGLSSRMGEDKAALSIAGEPLWTRQLRLLRQLEPDHLWISARTRPSWCPPGVDVILDEPPSRGPLSGLTAGLRRLRTSHLLALAIDLPRMTADPLRKLWSLARPGCGVIPANGELFEPLSAIYPIEAAAEAVTALGSGDVSLQSLARQLCRKKFLRIHRLSEAELQFFDNVNTPEDLERRRTERT